MIDIEATYRQFGPMVLRRCRSLLRDEALAVDAMHDVFVRLIRAKERLDDSAMSAMLLKISTQVCLNLLRTRRRRPEDAADERLFEIARVDEPEERSMARQVLGRIFARELDSTRALAVMHLVDGLTLEEVAREVGLSVSGVRKRLRTLKARVSGLEAV